MTAQRDFKSPIQEEQEQWKPLPGSGMRTLAMSAFVACIASTPILGLGAWVVYSGWHEKQLAELAAIEAAQSYERLVDAEPGAMVPLAEAVHGRELFESVCFACHGRDGKGVTGLGRNLVESDFVAGETDDQLRRFITVGRPNAKPVAMPPKGGRDELGDEDLGHIVAYMRGLQDPRRMPVLPAVVAAAPSEEQKKAALASAGGDTELAEYIASGDKLYHSTCVACHGKAGVGISGNGKGLASNAFVDGSDDDALLAFIKQGRSPTDPKNTTGIQMPPKGGNPAMSDDDILDVIAYLRTLQGNKSASTSGN